MCLYTKKELTVADKSLTCWKLVESIEGITEERITITPYAFVRIPDTVLKGIEPFKADKSDGDAFRHDLNEEACVVEGYIHTFKKLDADMLEYETEFLAESVGEQDDFIGANESAGWQEHPRVLAIQLWRCEIPAGTLYVEGETGERACKGYASDEIVFKEMVLEIDEDIAGWKHEDKRHAIYEELILSGKNV